MESRHSWYTLLVAGVSMWRYLATGPFGVHMCQQSLAAIAGSAKRLSPEAIRRRAPSLRAGMNRCVGSLTRELPDVVWQAIRKSHASGKPPAATPWSNRQASVALNARSVSLPDSGRRFSMMKMSIAGIAPDSCRSHHGITGMRLSRRPDQPAKARCPPPTFLPPSSAPRRCPDRHRALTMSAPRPPLRTQEPACPRASFASLASLIAPASPP